MKKFKAFFKILAGFLYCGILSAASIINIYAAGEVLSKINELTGWDAIVGIILVLIFITVAVFFIRASGKIAWAGIKMERKNAPIQKAYNILVKVRDSDGDPYDPYIDDVIGYLGEALAD